MASPAWGGGAAPFGIGSKKFGMWLFLLSDWLTFASLLVSYAYLRMAAPHWPAPFELVPSVAVASAMTLVLLSSSVTMMLGVQAMQRDDRATTVRWLAVTMAAGLLFLLLHAREWFHLSAGLGVTAFRNPWGAPLFGATFFGLTGLHMAHVGAGIVYLGVIATGVARNRFTPEDVEVTALFWHFVDLVWLFIFPLVYLMGVSP